MLLSIVQSAGAGLTHGSFVLACARRPDARARAPVLEGAAEGGTSNTPFQRSIVSESVAPLPPFELAAVELFVWLKNLQPTMGEANRETPSPAAVLPAPVLLLSAAPFDVAADAAPFEFGCWPAPHLLYNPGVAVVCATGPAGGASRSVTSVALCLLWVGGDGGVSAGLLVSGAPLMAQIVVALSGGGGRWFVAARAPVVVAACPLFGGKT
eukprot:CAMPEP_0172573506 /NCGR_PEP_ID=MMETSP1067-20121228/136219_1 /TAXON_ID=265564 ORGANISM="Thalassiosira punctigera, Strain Tpunct2005C2" /NCGR_SAMPLE_ID=MMETSP1067 /ASSEMBLY_ACC=CAM_ASM_000444 /LENGTH=210 /DNA_ID=CAMNT_0013366113 /DNA_START=2032 /DNA_END=2666 /DNA_ORIENTATION=-